MSRRSAKREGGQACPQVPHGINALLVPSRSVRSHSPLVACAAAEVVWGNVPKSSSKYKRLSDHRLLMLGTNRQGDVTRARIGLCLRGTFVGLLRKSRIGAGRRQLFISLSQTIPFPAQVPDDLVRRP
jgi:hypothetical protein